MNTENTDQKKEEEPDQKESGAPEKKRTKSDP
jgi:hypothetical protein